jgi:hypothetical protein
LNISAAIFLTEILTVFLPAGSDIFFSSFAGNVPYSSIRVARVVVASALTRPAPDFKKSAQTAARDNMAMGDHLFTSVQFPINKKYFPMLLQRGEDLDNI